MPKGEKKSMKNVIVKALEYHNALEELPDIANEVYLCRVAMNGDYGRFYIYYQTINYCGEGKWNTTKGIVTHWAEIPEVYETNDSDKL